MSATIKDVAKEAGVSVATVSRVLNGIDKVTDASAKRVRDAVEKLGYSPNFLGRNLRKRETNVILVIMPSSEHSLYMKICAGMQSFAQTLGYDIITASTNNSSDVEARYLNMLYNRTVDGAVFLGTSLDAATLNRLSVNYDIAVCCEAVVGANVLTVNVDDEQAGYDAADALIKKGFRRIAFIGAQDSARSSLMRETGFRKALEENGITLPNEYVYKNTYEWHNGMDAMDKFLALQERPEAVFAVSDTLAMTAMKKAVEKGLKVGEDIAIMGFDNISMCELMNPPLSTVEQPCTLMGETVCRKLISNISSDVKDNGIYTVKHTVILRGSTGD